MTYQILPLFWIFLDNSHAIYYIFFFVYNILSFIFTSTILNHTFLSVAGNDNRYGFRVLSLLSRYEIYFFNRSNHLGVERHQ